jgi:hypothetical protein
MPLTRTRPNPRLQRTPSAPLSRQPLGRAGSDRDIRAGGIGAVVAFMALFSCRGSSHTSSSSTPTPLPSDVSAPLPGPAQVSVVPTILPEGYVLPTLLQTGDMGFLKKADVTCSVACSVHVSAQGTVSSVQSLPSRCPMPFSAFEPWVRTFRFRPATLNDRPVPGIVTVTLAFTANPWTVNVSLS